MKNDFNDILLRAAEKGDLDMIKKAYEAGGNPSHLESASLSAAAMRGSLECVKWLLSHGAKAKDLKSSALKTAAQYGHLECLKFLLPYSDKHDFVYVLCISAVYERPDCVKFMLDHADGETAIDMLKERKQEKYGEMIKVFLQEQMLKVKHLDVSLRKNSTGL